MRPDFAESLFLFFVALGLFLALLLGGEAVVTAIGLIRGKGRVRPVAPPRLIMPDRYPGCLTCEAVEALGSVRHMVRHQLDDHTGGVRW